MQSSIVLLACCILSFRLVLAKSSIQLDEHPLIRPSHRAPSRPHSGSATRRSLIGRIHPPTVDDFASVAQSLSSETSYSSASSATRLDEGYSSVPSQAPTPAQPCSTSPPQPATPSTAALPVAPAQPLVLAVSSTPSCDRTNTKFEINRLLVQCEANIQLTTTPILTLVSQVTQENVQQLGPQLVTGLKELLNKLKLSLSNLQLCGMDAKPLSSNKGIALSDVSWSAFQVVLTLKAVFQSITALYKPFPIIQTICSDTLVTISTALAGIIGACGEQINLFDTRFFPLVTPQLEEFTELGDNFVSFVGTFES